MGEHGARVGAGRPAVWWRALTTQKMPQSCALGCCAEGTVWNRHEPVGPALVSTLAIRGRTTWGRSSDCGEAESYILTSLASVSAMASVQ